MLKANSAQAAQLQADLDKANKYLRNRDVFAGSSRKAPEKSRRPMSRSRNRGWVITCCT